MNHGLRVADKGKGKGQVLINI